MQSYIQANQTQQQLYGGPASTVAQGAGGQGMDFMQILQLMFAGNTSNAAGQECCSPGNGKDQMQYLASLQTNLLDELLPVTGEKQENRAEAGDNPATGESTLFELLAMLLDGMPESNRRPYAGGLVEQTSFGLIEPSGKLQVSNALLELLEDAAAKQIIGNDLSALPGRLNIAQEQIQQQLQYLNQDNIQALKQLEQNLMIVQKSTVPGSNTAGITQSAVEGSMAQNTSASLAEQLSIMLRDLMKNPGEKTPDKGLQSQPVLGKIETSPTTNISTAELKSPANNFSLNEATTATTGQGEVNGLPNANAALETSNNAHRADLTQVALNSVDSAAIVAKSTGGEAAPAVRSTEQPLFMQLAEAIRGQITKDGQGQTHVRLQLHPESLGEVAIKLVYKDGNVSTHFHAATETVRQIIESSLVQLRETLAAQNLNLQQSTVTAGNDQERWAQESNRDHQFNRPFRQSGNGRGKREEIASEPVTDPQKTDYQNRLNHFV